MVRSRMAIRRKRRSRSHLSWAGLTVAPWCLATGLLVSFVADAGQEVAIGMTRMDLTDLAPGVPAELIPAGVAMGSDDFSFPTEDGAVEQAHLFVGDPSDLAAAPDEVEPKVDLKPNWNGFPEVDRSRKGDPAVGLRPTFDTRLRRPGSLDAYRAAGLVFADEDGAQPPAGFVSADLEAPPDDAGRLQPLPETMSVTTKASRAPASPATGGGSTTPHVQDGSTPAVGRAVTLASTTPTDRLPVEITALPKFSRGPKGVILSNTPAVGVAQYHPDYGALIDGAKTETEQRCLAQAVYFEARSEPEEGQAAVAQVVLNRVMSGLYPASVCSVVFQNQEHRNACQFSFACEGHALRVTEADAWNNAVRIAREVTEGSAYVSDVGGSTHYHANYVRPTWARQLKKMDVIGHHIFYQLKAGQT